MFLISNTKSGCTDSKFSINFEKYGSRESFMLVIVHFWVKSVLHGFFFFCFIIFLSP